MLTNLLKISWCHYLILVSFPGLALLTKKPSDTNSWPLKRAKDYANNKSVNQSPEGENDLVNRIAFISTMHKENLPDIEKDGQYAFLWLRLLT